MFRFLTVAPSLQRNFNFLTKQPVSQRYLNILHATALLPGLYLCWSSLYGMLSPWICQGSWETWLHCLLFRPCLQHLAQCLCTGRAQEMFVVFKKKNKN